MNIPRWLTMIKMLEIHLHLKILLFNMKMLEIHLHIKILLLNKTLHILTKLQHHNNKVWLSTYLLQSKSALLHLLTAHHQR